MSEFSTSVMRAAALALFTALFAGIWSSDRPPHPGLARHLPADQRTYLVRRELPHRDLAATQGRDSRHVPNRKFRDTAGRSSGSLRTETRKLVRSWVIESDDLTIDRRELDQHMSRLPWGIPAGDYRIVDSQGGVGWLRITDEGDSGMHTENDDYLTTGTENSTVRFIRVHVPAVQTATKLQGIRR